MPTLNASPFLRKKPSPSCSSAAAGEQPASTKAEQAMWIEFRIELGAYA